MITLYDYFRSSAAYRVRIALNLKRIPFRSEEVHLVRDGGQQCGAAYRAINPQGRVPALRLEDGTGLTQSQAILEWIEETVPTPPLLPSAPVARAHVRAVAAAIACDIHPINNLSVLNYLRSAMGQPQDAVDAWYRKWILEGFKAIETLIEPGPFCFGGSPTFADLCLVPQVYNARRFAVPLEAFPKIAAVDAACTALDAFKRAHPDAVAASSSAAS